MNDRPDKNAGDSLAWSVRLSTSEPVRVAVVFGAALAALMIGTMVFRSPLLGFAGAAMVIGATMEYLIGGNYKVDESGASSRVGLSLTSMRWQEVKRVTLASNGLHLSPFENPGTMDAFRGVFLRYGAENRDSVLNAVRRFLPEDVRIHDGGLDGSGGGSPDR